MLSRNRFQDFHWENSRSRLLDSPNVRGSWTVYFMQPVVRARRFRFSIKVHNVFMLKKNSGDLMIGVADKNHEKRDTWIGHKGIGFAWCLFTRSLFFKGDDGLKKRKDLLLEKFRMGDTVTVDVNKDKGSILFYKTVPGSTEAKYMGGKMNINFPDELNICIDYYVPCVVELIKYQEYDQDLCLDRLGGVLERIEFLKEQKKMNLLRFVFLNKKLEVSKLLFSQSNIANLSETEECRIFEDVKVDFSENELFLILYQCIGGSDCNHHDYELLGVPSENLPQLYFFFRRLGMKKEVVAVNRLLSVLRQSKDLEHQKSLVKLLFSFCMDHETEIIKSLITNPNLSSPEILKKLEFNTSFALAIFNELSQQQTVTSKKHHQNHFCRFFELLESEKEFDFPLREFHNKILKSEFLFWDEELNKQNKTFSHHKDFEKNESLSEPFPPDLVLKTSDGFDLSTQFEILMVKSNYFFSMYKFGGQEVEEMQTLQSIQLVSLTRDVLQYMLEFFSTGSVSLLDSEKENSNEILLKCLVLSDRNVESSFFEHCLEILEKKVLFEMKKSEIVSMLLEFGHLIESPNLIHLLIPIFSLNCLELRDDRVAKLIQKSKKQKREKNEKQQMMKKLDLLIQLREQDGKRIQNLERLVLKMEQEQTKKIDELQKKLKMYDSKN